MFLDVSILAHPERWALLVKADFLAGIDLFQSSPTPKGGRYKATHDLSPVPSVFQSSPTPKGGRYFAAGALVLLLVLFQSSPTPKGGRYGDFYGGLGLLIGVSILAHPERWALLEVVGRPAQRVCGFNPRPPRKVGATLDPSGQLVISVVSILAHPERWALRPTQKEQDRRAGGFNPRPPRKVGATCPFPCIA